MYIISVIIFKQITFSINKLLCYNFQFIILKNYIKLIINLCEKYYDIIHHDYVVYIIIMII